MYSIWLNRPASWFKLFTFFSAVVFSETLLLNVYCFPAQFYILLWNFVHILNILFSLLGKGISEVFHFCHSTETFSLNIHYALYFSGASTIWYTNYLLYCNQYSKIILKISVVIAGLSNVHWIWATYIVV